MDWKISSERTGTIVNLILAISVSDLKMYCIVSAVACADGGSSILYSSVDQGSGRYLLCCILLVNASLFLMCTRETL